MGQHEVHVEGGHQLVQQLRVWSREVGFSQIGIADVDLATAEPGLKAWLEAGFHGSMAYMAAHGLKRARPAELRPGTVRILSARMDYLPGGAPADWLQAEVRALADPQRAVVSVYARGRDYHKVLRQRLQALADRLADAVGPLGHRVYVDSAPVLEVEVATRAGLGWRGKHTLTLSREAGSMFFLGEIFLDLPLPLDAEAAAADGAHCGTCRACIDSCPTQAIVAPYRLDARRCISYLTIEHDGAIDPALRPAMGNRIYGCDDCQAACPWNKYAHRSPLADFDVRAAWASPTLMQLWAWNEAAFLKHTEGSAIRRIGYARWRRNLAVALGNAGRETRDPAIAPALRGALTDASPMVAEHIQWALGQCGPP